jgi:plasmid stabilization system protein ParE
VNLPIVLLPEAQAEFDQGVDWYEQQRPGLGQDFIDSIRDVTNRISATPEAHAITYKDVRQAVVRRFPYNVLYRVETDRIVVVAVFHTSRNPKDWQGRV